MAFGLFGSRESWNFPTNNYGQIFGIADSGVEMFNGTPIKSLAREICQNSIDANNLVGEPTIIEFKPFYISKEEIPGFSQLQDAFGRAKDYWQKQKSRKAKTFFDNALRVSNQDNILCLRISDFNTTGLTGSGEEYNSPWCNLTKSQGASDKSGSNGGSFGIGKFAPYACSAFRTVFYSTHDVDGIEAYQGVSRLTSFKDKNGDTTQGTGFYGREKNQPISKQISLDPLFSRGNRPGSDIYIIAFIVDTEWKRKMVSSIIDGFLYAIYDGRLQVNVDDIVINRDTLPVLMTQYKPFEEYAILSFCSSSLTSTFRGFDEIPSISAVDV